MQILKTGALVNPEPAVRGSAARCLQWKAKRTVSGRRRDSRP